MGTGFFFTLPYHGHINPCLPVLGALTKRGETLVAFTTRTFEAALLQVGAEFHELPHTHREKRALATMAYWQLTVVRDSMTALVRQAQLRRAQYIVMDAACHWGYVLGTYLSLPIFILHSTTPTAFENISKLRSIALDLRNVPQVWTTIVRFLILDRYLAIRWHTSALLSPITIIQPRKADLQLVLTHECMRPRSGAVAYDYAGPCVRRRVANPAEPLPDCSGRPLIYVSLGTIWNDRADFYRLCATAIAGSEFVAVITVGSSVAIDQLSTPTENVHFRPHVDQIAALERASVFISHGGMSSLTEAMCAGVPLVLLPQANDQFPLSSVMVSHGVAIILDPHDLTVNSIRAAIRHAATDPQMRRECQRIRGIMADAGDGGESAAKRIIRALQSKPSEQLP